MIEIDYEKLKKLIERKGVTVLESNYLGEGVLGRYFPPNIIIMCQNLVNECPEHAFGKQKLVRVLLHEMCHHIKYLEHKDNPKQTDEEACFEFEEIVLDEILNNDGSINDDFECVKRLGLQNAVKFLKEVVQECAV